GYDPWFLYEMWTLSKLEQRLSAEELTEELLLEAKRAALSDKRISFLRQGNGNAVSFLAGRSGDKPEDIEALRMEWGIEAGYHFVDTCSGEFEAKTPYFYSTYGEINEAVPMEGR